MNKLIEPKSLLEVRKWKRKASEMIRKYGLKEAERRGSEWMRNTTVGEHHKICARKS